MIGGVLPHRLIETLLFRAPATDVRVMGGVAVLLAAVAATACTIPARRATRVNPIVALEG